MARYEMNDGCGVREIIEATSDEDAVAQTTAWLRGGDWHTDDGTAWVHGSVKPIGGIYDSDDAGEDLFPSGTIYVDVAINPDEPECTGQEHDWQSPLKVVGGVEENPGVYGHGGGVTITEVCAICGIYRVTDTWAQDPGTGAQGLRSVAYRAKDDVSEAWVDGREHRD